MFVYASKILPIFLDPFVLALLLLAGAVALRRVRLGLSIAALILIVAFSSYPVSDWLVGSLETQNPDPGIAPLPAAQAIVVLGGSAHGPSGRHAASRILNPSDRLLVALRLYHSGKAPLVLCSGGNLPLLSQPGELPEAEVMRGLLEEWGVPTGAILTEGGSLNTRENATGSYSVLSSRGVRRILLVTSAMHMPRAAAVFRSAGFEVIPAPADFRTGWGHNPLDWIPSAGNLIDSSQALRERLGLWVYRLRGWA